MFVEKSDIPSGTESLAVAGYNNDFDFVVFLANIEGVNYFGGNGDIDGIILFGAFKRMKPIESRFSSFITL